MGKGEGEKGTCLDEDQVGARLGEPDGDGLADAARAAGHDGGVVREGEELGGHCCRDVECAFEWGGG